MPDPRRTHPDMTLKIAGLVPPGQELHRRVLFDQLYASLPKDPEAKVESLHRRDRAQGLDQLPLPQRRDLLSRAAGLFEAHFEDGVLIRAKAGDVYSEPIGKMHRGHNPHDTIPYLCVSGFCVTAPDRGHVTNVVKAF